MDHTAGAQRRSPARDKQSSNWCIGIYAGDSPLQLRPAHGVTNPVVTCDDVTDVAARFVADPFMLSVDGEWHLFFEVMRSTRRSAAIGHAASRDGLTWRYDRLVLEEPFHLSYPCVFEWQGTFYLAPESYQSGAIRLYRAECFPRQWVHAATLLAGQWVDPSIFRFDDRWWMFAAAPPRHATRLHLFEALDLAGPWREHPASPVVRDDPAIARPAGQVVVHEGAPLRFAQDCSHRYGEAVRALAIVDLTPSRYREQAVAAQPPLGPSGTGWNAHRMHHVDPHQLAGGGWLACVDGDGGK
jgi:hypothetical protein